MVVVVVVPIIGVVVVKVLMWAAAFINMVVVLGVFVIDVWVGVMLADAETIVVTDIIVALDFAMPVPDFVDVLFGVVVDVLAGVIMG